ncbi:MAG TPA: VWA domain-containing protein, partial [Candidatus Limnocylindrales bacterium]|nr:VWA domain-containing protein [Candidatus Limnocylindrales bacterium]
MTTDPAITARADRRLIRANRRSQRFVLVGVTAPPATQQRDRLPVDLAFVLDRSGSMSGPKIALAKQTVAAALEHLDGRDRFSIVVYDQEIDVVVESTTGSPEAKRNAIGRLANIDARGSTNLAEGWFRGAEQVASHLAADGVNRCLVLTDGLANVGLTDPAVLAGHAAELRARGVSTTTFGVGADFDEALLQGIADAGGGHFYFVRDAATIRDHITSEVGETLEVVARDAAIEVVAAEGVEIEAISPQPTQRRGTRTVVSLGDLVAEQVLDVVLRVTFPHGEVGRETGMIVGLTDRDGVFADGGRAGAAEARLSWAYAD